MATTVRFPKQAWKDLETLRDTPQEKIELAIAELSKLRHFDRTSIESTLGNALGSKEAGTAAFRQLVSLHPNPERGSPFTSLKMVFQAIESGLDSLEGNDKWTDVQLAKWRGISHLFEKLITAPAIEAFSKGFDLRFEHEHLFVSARIISDLRPIFGTQTTTPTPSSAVVMHTLRIKYGSPYSGNGLDEQIHLAVDKNDLKRLQQACERALAKHEAIEQLADSWNLPMIDFESEAEDE